MSPDEVSVNSSFSISIIGENTQWLGQNIQNVKLIIIYYYTNNSSIVSNNLIIVDFSSVPNSGEYEIQYNNMTLQQIIGHGLITKDLLFYLIRN